MDFLHILVGVLHQLVCESELPVRTQNRNRGDVAVEALAGLLRLLLDFGQHLAHDLARGHVLGHVEQLGPAQEVVEVVLGEVVLRQTLQVAVLHHVQILNARAADADHEAI